MIKEFISAKILEFIISTVKNSIKDTSLGITFTKNDLEESINSHVREIKNWSDEISFNELKKPKLTREIYIDLQFFLYPQRRRLNHEEMVEIGSFPSLINTVENNIILLGQPGAGKTTTIKHLCQSFFLGEGVFPNLKLPIVIRLRELNSKKKTKRNENFSGPIIERLYDILGIRLDVKKDKVVEKSLTKIRVLKEEIVIKLLEELKILVILDGFDELVYKKLKEAVIEDIRFLSNKLEDSKFIVTSRTSDFYYNIDNTTPLEIAPLMDNQIFEFAKKMLEREELALSFFNDIEKSPFADTTIRPLNLAHLCAIYERVGKIPEKPKTVYKKIINLLLEDWDEQRSIVRYSRYANFEIDRKFEFLSSLAYILTTSLNLSVFTSRHLSSSYSKIYQDFGLEKKEMKQVVNELETHTGLFIQSGYDDYEFAHKSLQEYLTAEYIVKLPTIPSNLTILSRLPNELAIAVTISSNPSKYFVELILNRFKNLNFNIGFVKSFINRFIIEKPDFNINEQVLISALYLYSMYIEAPYGNPRQLDLFLYDPLTAEFEDFLKLIFKTNAKESVLKYYKIGEKILTGDSHFVNVLEMKDGVRLTDYPNQLYSRDSFF